jgi:PD-(D/E)XK nuclease superfamily
VTMGNSDAAIIRGLRRPRYEPQLTLALAALFAAEPKIASEFVRLLLDRLPVDRPDLPTRVDSSEVPPELSCSPEESFSEGRLDLRFRGGEWDVIVELKIGAGYGAEQLNRYLKAFSKTERKHAYLVAITRDVSRYGEPESHKRWLGSLQWRHLLHELRGLKIESVALKSQWATLLDVFEEEGSMGFTEPKPELFEVYGHMRTAAAHTDRFLEVLRHPLLDALRSARGGGKDKADLAGDPKRKPVIMRSRNGAAEIPFVVPAGGRIRVRAGLFAYDPPTRFAIAPHGAERLTASLDPREVRVRDALIDAGFRERKGQQRDLRALLDLDEEILRSDQLEERIVDWARCKFMAMEEAGFFALPSVLSDDLPTLDEDLAA